MRRSLPAVGILVTSLVLTFCDRLVAPPLPADAEQFSPPAIYSNWWNMTQECSEQSGSFGAVTWYKTDQDLHDPRNGDELTGYWSSADNRIVLKTSEMLNGSLVRHEMLHALLKAGGHPRNEFLGKCAGVVVCAGGCVRDAGPYPKPPETPIHIGDDSLDITVDIEPRNPTTGSGGFFSITVFARNRSSHWATVTPLLNPSDSIITFGYDVRGGTTGGGVTEGGTAADPSERIFAPGESKKMVFDFMIGDAPFGRQLVLGDYRVRGGFSDHWSADSSFVIGP